MDNWIIENDNLIAIQELLLTYEGKIDVMPIDPPYNTDIEYIGYKDSNFQNGWHSFMKPRLEIAYKLLSNKGVMFINIDKNELVQLINLCRSIFGEENVSTMVWKKTNERFDKNRVEKPLSNGARRTHEYVVVCFKNKNIILNKVMQPIWKGDHYENEEQPLETIIDNMGTTASAKDEIGELLGCRTAFSTPKPMKMIKEFIRAASNKQSIILDFFAGSGTTGHAVLDLNKEDGGHRKVILITNNESNIFRDVTVPRIQKAIVVNEYKDTFKVKPLPNYKGIIGMKIDVDMDRPIGTEHPKHPGIFYPINYGYVQGILGGDDEEQDVYVLEEKNPIQHFTGRVIAVVHRFDDVEDKWVAAPEGKSYTIEEIKQAVAFQEQFHNAEYVV